MPKPVDNPASRDAARQAQRVNRPQQSNAAKNYMGIGARPSQSQFGQILQERITQVEPQRFEEAEPEQEKPAQRQSEPRDSHKARESAHQEAAYRDRVRESRQRSDSREESDSREQRGGGEKKESGQHAKEAEQRVVAKQGRQDSRGQSEQRGREGRAGTGQEGQTSAEGGKAAARSGKASARPMWAQVEVATAGMAAARAAAKAALQTIPRQVMEQIVSYARLHSKKDGETEMELALQEQVFKGLRMRISCKDGKIRATFITSSRDVRELFLAEKNALRRELVENGLAVEGIDVIMT